MNSKIAYVGRWLRDNGAWNAWGGPQMRFKISGATYMKFLANCTDPNGTDISVFNAVFDNSSTAPTRIDFSDESGTLTGRAFQVVSVPTTGTHTVIIRTNGFNSGMWDRTSRTVLERLETDGTISKWVQPSLTLHCLGDSWMGNTNDWPRLIDVDKYGIYSIATGGLEVADMDARYLYDEDTVLNTSDPVPDGILISFGVNDYNAAVTTANFETSLSSLHGKIRARTGFGTVPIWLVMVPENQGAVKDYGQYGPNMSTVAGTDSNTYFIDTSSIEATITWQDDNHLDTAGKELMASTVATTLNAHFT